MPMTTAETWLDDVNRRSSVLGPPCLDNARVNVAIIRAIQWDAQIAILDAVLEKCVGYYGGKDVLDLVRAMRDEAERKFHSGAES